MASKESFEYLMRVCTNIVQKQKELYGIIHTPYVRRTSSAYLSQYYCDEVFFYDKIMSFEYLIKEDLENHPNRENMVRVKILLQKLFRFTTNNRAEEKLTGDEERELKDRLDVFDENFHNNFVRILKFYDIEAKFPSENDEKDIRFFCELRLRLINRPIPDDFVRDVQQTKLLKHLIKKV